MLREHEEGRAHVAAVRAALKKTADGDVEARTIVRRETTAYVALLRQHIFKENNVCFPLGDQAMTQQDKDELLRKFQCAAHGLLPPESHQKYIALAGELVNYGRTGAPR
jgi:hemerythrin-like domain-containing protein